MLTTMAVEAQTMSLLSALFRLPNSERFARTLDRRVPEGRVDFLDRESKKEDSHEL